jgi:two-component system sensor histidine kinase SenX3
MSMQIVYTPGIFGKIPHWALRTVIILIGLIGALMVGSIVYFYGLERTSSSQLQLQNDWVLNLAHTLRGPCHSLGVLTEAMKANANGELDELYLLARRELEAMDSHCRQFLQLARKDMKTAEMRIDSVAIKSLVETAIERVLTRYPLVKKDVVKPGELPEIMVKGNSAAAIETLMTVLDNAIKYSPEQKRISIACEHREKVLRLSVIDNGYGISAEDAAKVGTAFFRSSRSNLEGINGTGVGLYLAREACAAMGWEICIESEGTDKGTRVTFTIPVAEQ